VSYGEVTVPACVVGVVDPAGVDGDVEEAGGWDVAVALGSDVPAVVVGALVGPGVVGAAVVDSAGEPVGVALEEVGGSDSAAAEVGGAPPVSDGAAGAGEGPVTLAPPEPTPSPPGTAVRGAATA
jgi:hypothetical protein